MSDATDTQKQPADGQVTSKTPSTAGKNPKQVAAGKAVAGRMRLAHEAQIKPQLKPPS